MILQVAGGVRIEVTDDGSDLSAPVVKGDTYASDGHGLFLVQTLAEQWGCLRGRRRHDRLVPARLPGEPASSRRGCPAAAPAHRAAPRGEPPQWLAAPGPRAWRPAPVPVAGPAAGRDWPGPTARPVRGARGVSAERRRPAGRPARPLLAQPHR